MTEWKGKTRGGSFGYLFFIFLIKKFGITAAYGFLSTIVIYFIPFAPKATKSIWFYSRHILKLGKICSIKMLFKNYYRLGQTLIDKVAIGNGMHDKYKFCFENYEETIRIMESEQASIIIGAHVGNWEVGAPFFDRYSKKINIVLFDAEYQKIKEILKKNDVYSNYKVIPVNNHNFAHIFAIKEALDNKEYVCFQGDRYTNEERRLNSPFMGKEAFFPAGPFLLASKMNTPAIFYFAMREKRRTYRFHFVTTATLPGEKGKVKEQTLFKEYINSLENILKKYPEQWFNYYSFWGDTFDT